jgi:hypothetical protein
MSRSKRTSPFCPVSTCRLRLSYHFQAATSLGSTRFHLRADLPLASGARSAPGAFPRFPAQAIWVGHKPRPVHLSIIAPWISGLRIWSSQAVCGFGGG